MSTDNTLITPINPKIWDVWWLTHAMPNEPTEEKHRYLVFKQNNDFRTCFPISSTNLKLFMVELEPIHFDNQKVLRKLSYVWTSMPVSIHISYFSKHLGILTSQEKKNDIQMEAALYMAGGMVNLQKLLNNP